MDLSRGSGSTKFSLEKQEEGSLWLSGHGEWRGRMATYLVDLENTGLAGLTGLDELSVKDKVIVFYGARTGSIAFDKHVELTKAKADVIYMKTERVAKNYLDFQLVTYLGYLIGSGQESVYYIISKDKGYESCVEFWSKTDKQITITRCESLQKQRLAAQQNAQCEKAGAVKSEKETQQPPAGNSARNMGKTEPAVPQKQSSEPPAVQGSTNKGGKQTLPECMRKKVRKAVKEEALSSGSYKLLYDYIVRAPDKHELNVALVKGFQQERGNRLYKEIVDVFVEYQKQNQGAGESAQS